ncbi:MAG: leucine-rich repeat protein [Lachnospiraceae bacterium]|nr:leucine-rich repeat protein [Lachnospiraceae bacterium]
MKTITKKILSIIVILVLSITLLPMSAMAHESGDFDYELDDNGNAVITHYNGSGGEVTIPATLDNLPVTAIGEMAFYSNKSITRVTFEGGINTIGEDAFTYCDGLKSVTFKGDVGTIGEPAFYFCKGLTSVSFEGDVETIGAYAFYYCENLASVTFNGNVGTIGYWAFFNCRALKHIYFNGTEAEWNAVTKDVHWNLGCPEDMEVHFSEYTVGASVSPKDAGTVTGAGTYDTGTTATVIATPSNGYSFVNWTEGGNVASTNANYSFTVDKKHSLVANFKLNTYEIKADFNDRDGGTVSGAGTYEYGKEITLVATPKDGYVFECWTVDTDSNWKSHSSDLKITVNGNQTYKAWFWKVSVGNITPQEYTGSQIKPTGISVQLIGVDFRPQEGKDYKLDYGENVRAGKDAGSVTVEFKGNFTGEATKTFDIIQKSVTVSGITAKDKVIDGTTDAELDLANVTITGVLEADKDKLTVTATGTFEDAEAGKDKTVSITGLTLSGDAASNYQLAEDGQQTSTTATILEKKVYDFTSGAGGKWTSGSADALEFVVKANRDDDKTIENFVGIEVDGNTVEKEASGKANWIATKGSVVIDLQPDYLKTLSAGDHTLTVLFKDAASIETTFTIKAAPEETKPADTSPKTGDGNRMVLWVTLMAAALAGGISILIVALKRRQQ